jgi:hypothetical protein
MIRRATGHLPSICGKRASQPTFLIDSEVQSEAAHTISKEILPMSKQEEAGLILKLYELRREETMRTARDWYFREFNPQTMADFSSAMFGAHSGHLRMVVTYWDMATALVNDGAISAELFNNCNGEHISVFAKVELLLPEIRATFGPQFGANLEKFVDATAEGRKRTAAIRERMKAIRDTLAKQQAQTA